MPAPTGATAAHEHEWCALRAEGLSYGAIAAQFGVSRTAVASALQKPANAAHVRRAIREIREAAILAARHNIASSVSEKCRLRLALAKNLGIDEGATPRVGIDSTPLIRDYLAVDKALNDQLNCFVTEDVAERVQDRLDRVDKRDAERWAIEKRQTEELDKIGRSLNEAEEAPEGATEAILPANGRESL